MQQLLKELIRVETPIHKEYLVKRVQELLGYEKITNDLRQSINDSLPERLLKIGDFYFNFKVSDIRLRLESNRDIQYIHTDELADGIYNVVVKNNGVSESGAFKTVVNMLGADKVTAQSKKLLTEALEHLILDHKIKKQKDNLFITK